MKTKIHMHSTILKSILWGTSFVFVCKMLRDSEFGENWDVCLVISICSKK